MRRAFRIVAAVLGVSTIALTLPFAITSFTDDAESIHRLHFLAGVFASGLLLGVSLLVCARRPESIGPFWVAVATGIASTIAGLISGDFISGLWFIAPISLVILIALHPERSSFLHIHGIEVATAFLGLVALVPAVAFALTQAELQRNGVVSNPHVELHHYSGMASYALSLPLAAFAAALLVPGRRIAGWIVGVTGAALGAASLLLSDYPGAFETAWAWLTLAWGVALVVLAQLRRETA
ncbi:MAG TPA: hypothetical protein VJ573_00735 [Actinomycetota bacterium]|jgi:hypothetical protein|nr:hypothetical protein [Actinomycetota bacterium]